MKIEHAYSTDLEEVVDIDTAYELFTAGRIRDKRNFLCLFPDCDGDITAANLDKLRSDMAVDPYFKRVRDETHSRDCLLSDTALDDARGSADEPADSRTRKRADGAEPFLLQRPVSHQVTAQSGTPADPDAARTRRKRRGDSPSGQSGGATSPAYSVGTLVSRYHKYRRLGIADQKNLDIKGYRLPYSELFVRLDAQDVGTLSPRRRVYYGPAYVDEKADGYRIGFADPLLLDGARIKPSLYISREQIRNAFSRKLCEAKFNEISKRRRPETWFFVYGKPAPRTKDGKTYLNLNVSNLDFLDFRDGFVDDGSAPAPGAPRS